MKHILVVEDDPDVGFVIAHALRKGFGAEVEVVADGTTGLERARSGGFDLVLCDLMLPGLDGMELVRRLKQVEGAEVPVVFLTAATGAFARRPASDLGAIGVLSKPVDVRRLCAQLAALLEAARRPGEVAGG